MLSLGTVMNYWALKYSRVEDAINERSAKLDVAEERAKKVDQ